MYHVYVIQSKRGLIYKGQTDDLDERLKEHNQGRGGWTSQDTNWELIYSKDFETRTEGIKYERWLKTGAGRDFLNQYVQQRRDSSAG
jgi:putative endonuclease